MLGRMRPSSSSLECLELERSPPKIVKHDSLSVYEATLVKLRQGSQRDLVSSTDVIEMVANCNSASNFPDEDVMTTNSKEQLNKTVDVMTTNSKEQLNKTVSVIHMFTRYKSSQRALSSRDQVMIIEDNSSSAGSSPSAGTVDR